MPNKDIIKAKSLQSVLKNIEELNEKITKETTIGEKLRNSLQSASAFCVYEKNGKTLFGWTRKVGFEGMTSEKYVELVPYRPDGLSYNKHLTKWFDWVTYEDQEFEPIYNEYVKWRTKLDKPPNQEQRQNVKFLIIKTEFKALNKSQNNFGAYYNELTQDKIEIAVDKYCRNDQKAFDKNKKFSSGTYWFRSAIQREDNQIFPTFPIVSVALNRRRNEGLMYGWKGIYAACLHLHNLGYIVTWKDGKPVTEIKDSKRKDEFDEVPDEIDFLKTGNDWIQAVAKNYCIEPARKNNFESFSIDPNRLHNDIGSYRTIDDVINALNDKKFHENMEIMQTESEDSSSILNFKFINSINKPTNSIYYGPPGTGKTYISVEKAVELCLDNSEFAQIQDRNELMTQYQKLCEDEQIEFVTFHQSFSYEEFVEGLRPTTNNVGETYSNQSGGFELKTRDGIFKIMCQQANDNPTKNFVLIIDEINRANISKVFGELITLLEPDKRIGTQNAIQVLLPYSGDKFGIPPNLHIIGTMNTADRSIAQLDTALRRRFKFEELMPDLSKLSENVEGLNLQAMISKINERIENLYDREHQIGHAKFLGCETLSSVEVAFRNYVIPLLAEYFFQDRSKIAEVLEDQTIGASNFNGCFLSATVLNPPNTMIEDEVNRKFRWIVKKEFDFTQLHSYRNN